MRTLMVALGVLLAFAAPARAGGSADKDVLAAMDVWKEAMLKKDRAAFDKVLHPDLTYGHASGVVETKAQAIEHVVGNAGTYVAINLTDTKVRVQGNTALVTGKAEYVERIKDKETRSNLVVLSVWLKGRGGWQMIARQATKPPPAPAAPAPAH
jgi:ketosteroid isomerase-like protein